MGAPPCSNLKSVAASRSNDWLRLTGTLPEIPSAIGGNILELSSRRDLLSKFTSQHVLLDLNPDLSINYLKINHVWVGDGQMCKYLYLRFRSFYLITNSATKLTLLSPQHSPTWHPLPASCQFIPSIAYSSVTISHIKFLCNKVWF